MAGETETKLSLVIRAIDKASPALNSVTKRIEKATGPVTGFGKSLDKLGEVSGLSALGSSLKNVGSAVGNVGHEAVALVAKFAAMAAGAGFALYEIVKGSVDAGAELAEMSKRTGLSVDAFSSLQFAAGQAHVSQEQFNASMDQFTKRLGEAKAGGGPLLEFLNKVSPSLGRQVKGAKSTEAALSLMTDAFARLQDPMKIAALSSEAFGKGSLQMGQFLHQGSAAIQALQGNFLDLAGSQASFATGSEDLQKVLRQMDAAFEGTKNAAMTALYPAITQLSEALTDFLKENREGLTKWATETGAAITDWVKGGGLQDLGNSLKSIGAAVKDVVDALGGMKGVAVAVTLVMGAPLIGALLGVVPAVVGVVTSLITLNTALGMVGLTLGAVALPIAAVTGAAIGLGAAGYEIYKHWDDLKFLFKDFWNGIVFDAQMAWKQIKPIVDAFASVMQGTGFGSVASKLSGFGDSVSGALGSTKFDLGTASLASQSSSSEPAKVEVSFSNAPKGLRVSTEQNVSTEVNYSAGPLMVGG